MMSFYQIAEEDKHKTAFNTRTGHWELNQMSFGLTSAVGTFVTAMNQILSGEAYRAGRATAKTPGQTAAANPESDVWKVSPEKHEELSEDLLQTCCSVYLDDVIIASKDAKEHAVHLRKVLRRFEEYGLLLKSSKSFFAKDQVEYLGHIVTPEGITVCADKVKAVAEWTTPKTSSRAQTFVSSLGSAASI